MPAAKGKSEGSFYRITKGKRAGWWEGAVVIGWKPDGSPHRKTVTRKDEDAARKAYRELLNRRDAGLLKTEAKDWTVAEWVTHWLDVIRKDDPSLSPSTRGHYASKVRVWIGPKIGSVTLDKLLAHHGAKVLTAMEKAGSGASNRKQVYVVLKAALDAAVVAKLIPHNPMASIDAPTVKRKQISFLESEDVQAIYEEILDDRMEARWLVALMLGLRQGEALGLEWRHINRRARTVLIEQQLQRLRGKHGCGDPVTVKAAPEWAHGCGDPLPEWAHGRPVYPCGRGWASKCPQRVDESGGERTMYPCGRGWASKCPTGIAGRLALVKVKSERGNRTLPLTDDLLDILDLLAERQKRERLAEGDSWRGWRIRPEEEDAWRDIDLIFRRTYGMPLEPHDDWEAWKALLKRAGIAPKRLHDARHAAAIALIDSGVKWDSLSRLMGHSSSAFTSDIYGHLSREAADGARDAMQSHHGRLRGKRSGTVTPIERANS